MPQEQINVHERVKKSQLHTFDTFHAYAHRLLITADSRRLDAVCAPEADSDYGIIKNGETIVTAVHRLLKKSKIGKIAIREYAQIEDSIRRAICAIYGINLETREHFHIANKGRDHDGIDPIAMKHVTHQEGISRVITWVHPDWLNKEPNQKTNTNGDDKMSAKTMYDSHLDSTGNATPIFMLEDDHLERIIAGKAKQFVNLRAKMSESPASSDPMIAAMGKSQKWSAEQLQANTRLALGDIHPYIAEALVRGNNSLVQASIDAMRLLAKREAKIDPPQELQLIAMDEEESF